MAVTFRGVGICFSLAGTLAVAACSSQAPQQAKPEMQEMPQHDFTEDQRRTYPGLQVGDSFRFDSPDVVWRVTGVKDDRVIMVSETGARQVRPRNPLLPNVEWENKTYGQGKRLISNLQGEMFPLEVGNQMTFTSTVDTDKPPYAWEYDWSCKVASQQKVTVPAGEFDTFKVDCKRREQEVISLYYAPKVGYAVRFDNSNPKSGAVNSNMLVGYQRGDTVVGQIVPSNMKMEKKPEMVKKPAATQKQAIMPKPEVKPATEPKENKMVMAPAGGGYVIHLESYKHPENLEPSWTQLQKKYRTELQGLGHMGKRVDIPGKGVYTRLLAGPISDHKQAERLCRQIKAGGHYCAVMKR